ncbi:nucleotide sugar dehydrogenase [Halorubrum ezzemoulense]|uniref:UDP-N-acetyl-D-mannosamine dehydrogenase n=1 Tax=Halorubrum ezzemoulense TaxID=337243 RepID=A0ABT4Z513_HALEZ|nr:nucleotide sugar dehydrogenase [Halorubrum ezzemoulense]MDB2293258.1 nucleotide sugar dehydrogenase [Halorubrum ezzemoulense]
MSDSGTTTTIESNQDGGTATICVVGLGYVGLPLAVGFDQAGHTVRGYDISPTTVEQLRHGEDPTGDVGDAAVSESDIEVDTDPAVIEDADVVVVTVPTPVTDENDPNLDFVEQASATVGEHLSAGATVVLESTVFPGATREIVAPTIEEASGFKLGEEFSVGYSPERLVPGDDAHSLENVVKIVSGSDDETLVELVALYESIVDVGVHEAPSLEVAEAAKCIENVQRDVNIALINELSVACDRLGIDSNAVLEAAGTKWNFHDYRPGLVGGHCIPVDPFFFIYQSKKNGFDPELIETAREVNEYMPKHVAKMTIKALNQAGKVLKESRVLVLGLTYKPNVEDIRTSAIDGTIEHLEEYDVEVVGHDPHARDDAMRGEFEINVQPDLSFEGFDAVILGAAHDEYVELDFTNVAAELSGDAVIIDSEGVIESDLNDLDVFYDRI